MLAPIRRSESIKRQYAVLATATLASLFLIPSVSFSQRRCNSLYSKGKDRKACRIIHALSENKNLASAFTKHRKTAVMLDRLADAVQKRAAADIRRHKAMVSQSLVDLGELEKYKDVADAIVFLKETKVLSVGVKAAGASALVVTGSLEVLKQMGKRTGGAQAWATRKFSTHDVIALRKAAKKHRAQAQKALNTLVRAKRVYKYKVLKGKIPKPKELATALDVTIIQTPRPSVPRRKRSPRRKRKTTIQSAPQRKKPAVRKPKPVRKVPPRVAPVPVNSRPVCPTVGG